MLKSLTMRLDKFPDIADGTANDFSGNNPIARLKLYPAFEVLKGPAGERSVLELQDVVLEQPCKLHTTWLQQLCVDWAYAEDVSITQDSEVVVNTYTDAGNTTGLVFSNVTLRCSGGDELPSKPRPPCLAFPVRTTAELNRVKCCFGHIM